MSLRARLGLLITVVFLLVLAVSTALVVRNARRAVYEEVQSTAHLTLQMFEIALAAVPPEGAPQPLGALIERLGELERTRHMAIEIRGVAGLAARGPRPRPDERPAAPAWFVRLVEPAPIAVRQSIAAPGMPPGEIIIRSAPADEIAEAWRDTRTVLAAVLAAGLAALALVHVVIGRALAPIDAIVAGLAAIEQGDYRARLPRVRPPELGRIAEKVNRIAAALEASRAQTRRLAQRSLAIQERERRHLAHELHDEMGQSISAIKAVAVSIDRRAGAAQPEIAASARTISEICSSVYDTVRGMMHRLRPASLDELGLATALAQLVDDWNTRHTDTFCALDVQPGLAPSGEEVGITVYRIVQEALTNVARHARAGRVEVRLHADAGGGLALEVCDDGVGFDPQRVTRGLGLLGIEERVAAAGGELVLATRPGAGVRIAIRIPAGMEEGGDGR